MSERIEGSPGPTRLLEAKLAAYREARAFDAEALGLEETWTFRETMTVAELIEKLSQCSPDALVVVEDNECGFDADWSVLVLDADVNRTRRPVVHYVSQYLSDASDWNRERVVALTAHGHGSGYNVVEL